MRLCGARPAWSPSGSRPGGPPGRAGNRGPHLRDESFTGELVCHAADPIGEPEDLVNEDDDTGLVLALGIDHPRLDRSTGRHLDVHELPMSRRFLQDGLRLLLRRGKTLLPYGAGAGAVGAITPCPV